MKLTAYDWRLYGPAAMLAGMGLLMLASSSPDLFWKQFIWLIVSGLVIFIFQFFNIVALLRYRWVVLLFYGATILFLLLTIFFAPKIGGQKNWLVLGPVHLQPSEFVKIALVILFARFFSKRHVAIARWSTIFVSGLYLALPVCIVLLQPDLGTALVLAGLWFGFLLVSGLPWKYIALFFGAAAAMFCIAWFAVFAPYQKERIKALFDPTYDPLGVNYNVIQSKIAVGSAGFWGKGFGQGTQVRLGFLPEAQTDFAFAAFVEEWGLLGAFFACAAFALLVYRIMVIGMRATSNFGRYICLGTAIMLMIHFVINVGSALGLFPVIGVPFPLLSYGGSNLLTIAILFGIITHTAGKRLSF